MSELDIAVSPVGMGRKAKGWIASAVVYRNIGARTCRLYGYPQIAALDANGSVLDHFWQMMYGEMGGVNKAPFPNFALEPGASASTLLEGRDVACPSAPVSIRIVLPFDMAVKTLGWQGLSGCAELSVHPFVPGESGNLVR